MDSLLLDLRFAARSLRRRPMFAAVAITTIALAIGASTAIFSVVDGVLFRSLAYRDAGQLVGVWQTDPDRKAQALLAANWDRTPLDYTDFITWRSRQTAFTGVGVYSGFGAMLANDHGPEEITGRRVSPGFFEMLGVQPVLGRTFLPGEDVLGGPHVTMLSYETWTSRFGGRKDVIGSTIRFDETPYEIIGVLPKGFTLERGKAAAPFWIPAGQQSGDVGHQNRGFRALGRLKPGVTLEKATVETQQLLNANTPGSNKGVRLTDVIREETRDVRAPMLILLGAVGLLLLIACVNVATLLLGEAANRDVEMSARVAIGATRGRIIRQLLTESVLLSTTGAAAGALLAWWGTKAIVALAPSRIPGILAAKVDGRVLGLTLIAAIVTGILFGLVPALTLSESGPATLLRAGKSTRGRGALQRTMIAMELALSVVLLVGAGLLSRSLQKLAVVDPGFRPNGLITVSLSLPNPYRDTIQLRQFYANAITRLTALPGVGGVTAASNIPFTGGSSSSPYLLVGEGDAERKSHKHEVQQRVVASKYFETMGMSLIAGRDFTSDDRTDTPPVAIISEAAARRDFPNESALGKRVLYQGVWREIVGIVKDVKYSRLSSPDQPSIYTALSQRVGVLDIVVRANGDPTALVNAVRTVIHDVGPTVAISDVENMNSLIQRSFSEERFRAALFDLFATIAAVLAGVGMFGVTARAVSRRRHEVGIRVALGATSNAVVRMIVGNTLTAVAAGVIAGVAASAAATRLLVPYLYGVESSDPLTYAAILVGLALVSIAASWMPARRAGRVEPAVVLRGD
jgi:predicted permease